MTRFKQVAIPSQYKDPEGDYTDAAGVRYRIPEELVGKVGCIPFTPEEEAAADAEQAAYQSARPLELWKEEINQLDARMTRREEDMIDWLLKSAKLPINDLAEPTRLAYQAKKAKRAERPK